MKKHLIVAAVAAAVAVPAAAQSTVYGRIDTGYSVTDITGGNKTTETTQGKMYTSLLGFRGSEDLGGGLKAGFVVETTIGGAGSTAALGDRLLYTELSGAFGSIRIGRDNSLAKMVYDGFDAGGSNNVRGVVDSIAGDAKGSGNSELEYDPRVTVIRFTSPNFNGLTVAGGVVKSTVTKAATDDVKTGDGYEAGINYAAGPFKAGLAIRKADQRNVASYVLDTAVTAATNKVSLNAQNLEDKVTNFGASYDLGIATAFFQYMDGDRKNLTTASNGYKEKLMTFGIRANVGATTVFASVTDGERKPSGAADLSREGYQVGAMYNLSKRTRAYVAFGADEFNTSATAKTETDQTVFGIVHTF